MPKSRKTRKQKMKSDEKRKIAPQQTVTHTAPSSTNHTFTFSPTASPAPTTGAASIEVTSYHYLVKDLRKTLFLTLFIIVMEFILSFFMS